MEKTEDVSETTLKSGILSGGEKGIYLYSSRWRTCNAFSLNLVSPTASQLVLRSLVHRFPILLIPHSLLQIDQTPSRKISEVVLSQLL